MVVRQTSEILHDMKDANNTQVYITSFWPSKAQISQEWLSRIRVYLITVALHCGMYTVVVRQTSEILHDMKDANNTQVYITSFWPCKAQISQEWLSRIRVYLITVTLLWGMYTVVVRQTSEILHDMKDANNTRVYITSFWPSKAQISQEWLSRIRTVALHCGMYTVVVRQTSEILHDMKDANNTQVYITSFWPSKAKISQEWLSRIRTVALHCGMYTVVVRQKSEILHDMKEANNTQVYITSF